jgi:hypothetical protein
MAAATLNLGGKKFVVIPESEYRAQKANTSRNGTTSTKRRPTRQERGDVAESIRRLKSDKRVPLDEVARKLGWAPTTLKKGK